MPCHNPANSWFESISTARSTRLRLFCFPYGGGSAHVFRDWQPHLGPEIDVCLAHLPGRARRMGERPRTRLHPLVEEMADAIRPELRGRFAFYGHSMGALISFELARELRRRKYGTPVHLFLSACRAPNVVRSVPPTFNLPLQEFMAKIRKLGGTPKDFFETPELQKALLPLLRADFEITDTYEYVVESPLGCHITVYGGEQDELASVNSLTPWELQTTAECKTRLFPGGHFFIHNLNTKFVRILRLDLLQTLSAS
ncbi:MAG TPA: thioesterase domain-containing protein [Candidatus Dormibacteraeota bacterium]|nr:thioesterase domain-containing protein [Candidatus Dormibacteraeota bacterium]